MLLLLLGSQSVRRCGGGGGGGGRFRATRKGVLEKLLKKSSHERSLALPKSLSQSLHPASASVDTDPFKVSRTMQLISASYAAPNYAVMLDLLYP